MIKSDTVECITRCKPYNSPMEASILICNNNKGEIERINLFIDALNEVKREKTNSFLTKDNIGGFIQLIDFKNEKGLLVMTMKEVLRMAEFKGFKVYTFFQNSK